MKFLVINALGDKYLIEAPTPELARDAAALDGGEIVATIHMQEKGQRIMAEDIHKILEDAFDKFMNLAEVKKYWGD